MKSEPYVLAISTYALALGDSSQKWTFKKWLGDIARNQNGGDYDFISFIQDVCQN